MMTASQQEPTEDWVRKTEQIRIRYPQWQQALQAIAECHRWSLRLREPPGVAIFGDSGAGKSTLAEHYEARFPRYRNEDGQMMVEVLRVVVPSTPTLRSTVSRVLQALGDPAYNVGRNTSDLTHRLATNLERCATKVILFDELNHLVDNANANVAGQVADWIKAFFYARKISIILLGLPHSDKILHRNKQLKERYGRNIVLEPLVWGSRPSDNVFGRFLREFDLRQPYPEFGLASPDMAFRMWLATRGNVRRICRITTFAVANAVDARRDRLAMVDFRSAFDRWIQGGQDDDPNAPTENPF